MRRLTRSQRAHDWSLLALALFVSAGCAAPSPPLLQIGPDIAVPAQELRPVDRCMFEAGFRATAVHKGRAGSNGVYSWQTTTYYTWEPRGPAATVAAMANCAATFGAPRLQTLDELRDIYKRWILERQCLVSLGFHPREPPTFAEFDASWQVGPWMPIDGIPFEALTNEAKARCGLEMLD